MIPYEWLKALHVISVFAWMAGMLYLPRLFVYHANAKPGSELSETLKVMERRLLRAIINPAMGAAWIFGLWMAWVGDLWGDHLGRACASRGGPCRDRGAGTVQGTACCAAPRGPAAPPRCHPERGSPQGDGTP